MLSTNRAPGRLTDEREQARQRVGHVVADPVDLLEPHLGVAGSGRSTVSGRRLPERAVRRRVGVSVDAPPGVLGRQWRAARKRSRCPLAVACNRKRSRGRPPFSPRIVTPERRQDALEQRRAGTAVGDHEEVRQVGAVRPLPSACAAPERSSSSRGAMPPAASVSPCRVAALASPAASGAVLLLPSVSWPRSCSGRPLHSRPAGVERAKATPRSRRAYLPRRTSPLVGGNVAGRSQSAGVPRLANAY